MTDRNELLQIIYGPYDAELKDVRKRLHKLQITLNAPGCPHMHEVRIALMEANDILGLNFSKKRLARYTLGVATVVEGAFMGPDNVAPRFRRALAKHLLENEPKPSCIICYYRENAEKIRWDKASETGLCDTCYDKGHRSTKVNV